MYCLDFFSQFAFFWVADIVFVLRKGKCGSKLGGAEEWRELTGLCSPELPCLLECWGLSGRMPQSANCLITVLGTSFVKTREDCFLYLELLVWTMSADWDSTISFSAGLSTWNCQNIMFSHVYIWWKFLYNYTGLNTSFTGPGPPGQWTCQALLC